MLYGFCSAHRKPTIVAHGTPCRHGGVQGEEQAVVEEQAMVRGFLLWKLSAQHNLSFFLFSANVDAEQHEFQLAAAAASNAAYKAQVLAQIELNEPPEFAKFYRERGTASTQVPGTSDFTVVYEIRPQGKTKTDYYVEQ